MRIPDNYHATFQQAEADDASLAVILARVFDLHRNAGKDDCGIREIQAALGAGLVALRRIEGYAHKVIVTTTTGKRKSVLPLHRQGT